MTAKELRDHFNKTFGLVSSNWPKFFVVDGETYANVCQQIFDQEIELGFPPDIASVFLGDHGGAIFLGVELLIKGVTDERPSKSS